MRGGLEMNFMSEGTGLTYAIESAVISFEIGGSA